MNTNYSTAIFLINEDVRGVLCSYENRGEGRTPETTLYKTFDPNIKAGDFVTVPTTTRWKMTVVKVEEVDVSVDPESQMTVDWIIGVVNTISFETLKSQENEAIEVIKAAKLEAKKAELRKDLLANSEKELAKLPITSIGQIKAPPVFDAETGTTSGPEE